MAAATYNFAIEKGSDFDITFKYNDENGIGKDLSGLCVFLRLKAGTPPIEIVFSTATGASLQGDLGYLFRNIVHLHLIVIYMILIFLRLLLVLP